jgi:DHA2 family multidrug resistance protein
VSASVPLHGAIDAPRRLLITLSVIGATLLQALDNTIANVALPHIRGSVSATQDQMSWVLTSYIIAAAIMTPLSGWLAGRVGRKRVFLVSVAGFVVASMLCGLSQSLPQIVLARLLQGLCGAALVPLSQAVLLDVNPPERQPVAMSMWAMAATLGPIMGPALGGWLTENYSWRWVFYINVPFGILAFIGILASLPETTTHKSRFDFVGFATLSAAVGAFQLFMDRGQLEDWFSSTEICIEAAVAATAFYIFIVHMMTSTERRFVNPALFKDRNFITGNIFIFLMGVVMFSTLALLPPMLQDLMNYPVVTTGMVTAPRGLGSLTAMFIVPRLLGKFDVRALIAFGLALTAFSSWQMTGFDLQMGSSAVVWSGILQGIGMGFVYVPVATTAFATLRPLLRNEGTSIFSLMRNLGASVGISVVTTLLTRNTQIAHAALAAHVTSYGSPLHAVAGAATTSRGMTELNGAVTQQAAMIAYNDNFKLLLVLSLASIPLVLLLRKGRGGAPAEPLAME